MEQNVLLPKPKNSGLLCDYYCFSSGSLYHISDILLSCVLKWQLFSLVSSGTGIIFFAYHRPSPMVAQWRSMSVEKVTFHVFLPSALVWPRFCEREEGSSSWRPLLSSGLGVVEIEMLLCISEVPHVLENLNHQILCLENDIEVVYLPFKGKYHDLPTYFVVLSYVV